MRREVGKVQQLGGDRIVDHCITVRKDIYWFLHTFLLYIIVPIKTDRTSK